VHTQVAPDDGWVLESTVWRGEGQELVWGKTEGGVTNGKWTEHRWVSVAKVNQHMEYIPVVVKLSSLLLLRVHLGSMPVLGYSSAVIILPSSSFARCLFNLTLACLGQAYFGVLHIWQPLVKSILLI